MPSIIDKNSSVIKSWNNVKGVPINAFLKAAIKVNYGNLTKLQSEQTRKGESPTGGFLKAYANFSNPKSYGALKRMLSTYRAKYPSVDLYLTGNFIKAFFTKLAGNKVLFSSTDRKASKLEARYQVFGLNVLNTNTAKVFVTNTVLRLFNKKLKA